MNVDGTATESQSKVAISKPVTKYRIHISFHHSIKSASSSSFILQGDLFQSLPLHKAALDSQGIQKLRQDTLNSNNLKSITEDKSKRGLSSRKRGKSIAKHHNQHHQHPFNSQLDNRFGPIHIDWADRDFEIQLQSSQLNQGMSASSNLIINNSHPSPTSPRQPQVSAPVAKFLKKSSFSIPERNDPRDSFKTGGTDVSFGIVHLFKDLDQVRRHNQLQESKEDRSNIGNGNQNGHDLDEKDFPPLERSRSNGGNQNEAYTSASASTSTSNQVPSTSATSSEETITLESDDSGCILAVLAVPALMSASDFLAFVEPALDAISHLRMLREPQPNRCLVLIKFRDSRDAEEFHKLYDGELFNAMNPNEVAQVVYVTSVTMSYHSKLPYSFPGGNGENGWPVFPALNINSKDDNQTKQAQELILKEKLVQELPTCAVCLERMDETVSGLMTVACQHTFHCSCLSKWSDGRCPVCRYSQSRQISNARLLQGLGGVSTSNQDENQEESAATCCTICKTESDLWLCMVCGNCGCGRYKEGHAKEHYLQTRHLYSLELETQRVWDYAGDNYIHRLIQNKADGKLVELPSSSSQMSNLNVDGSSASNNDTNGVSSAYHSDKIEAIGLEYSYLLTSQLESQRSFYESQLKELKTNYNSLQDERDREKISFKDLELKNCLLLKEIEEFKDTRKKDEESKNKNEKKLEKSLELIRHLQNELGNERSVSKGLMSNLERLKENEGKIKEEVAELKDQVKDLMVFLSARDQIEKSGEGAGGDVSIGKKKKKK